MAVCVCVCDALKNSKKYVCVLTYFAGSYHRGHGADLPKTDGHRDQNVRIREFRNREKRTTVVINNKNNSGITE